MLEFPLRFILLMLIWVAPVVLGSWLVFFLATLPMRRHERARFFLDLVEDGLKHGRSAEQTIVSASASRDLTLGARFHLVAEYVASGLRLNEAIARVPSFLPPRIHAMLEVGGETGDLRRIIPGCPFISSGRRYCRCLVERIAPYSHGIELRVRDRRAGGKLCGSERCPKPYV